MLFIKLPAEQVPKVQPKAFTIAVCLSFSQHVWPFLVHALQPGVSLHQLEQSWRWHLLDFLLIYLNSLLTVSKCLYPIVEPPDKYFPLTTRLQELPEQVPKVHPWELAVFVFLLFSQHVFAFRVHALQPGVLPHQLEQS